MIARVRSAGGVRYLALCAADGVWVPIAAQAQGEPEILEAAAMCAAHLGGTIRRAMSAAHRARERMGDDGGAAREYLELAIELLAQANVHAARLLDAPGPEDALAPGIEPA